jgi:hypothetical protein
VGILSAEHVRRLSAATLQIANACQRLADASAGNDPRIGSQAATALASSYSSTPSWRGEGAITRGLHEDLYFATLAAVDQAHALVVLTRDSRTLAPSVATVTRSVVEALARVDWLLSSPTTELLIARGAQLQISDLRYALEMGVELVSNYPDGRTETTPIKDYVDDIQKYLIAYGLPRLKDGRTAISRAFLKKDYNEPNEIYSGLSAAAHGETHAIGNFRPRQLGALQVADGSVRLVLSDTMTVEYHQYAITSFSTVGEDLARYFVPTQDQIDRWSAARQNALAVLNAYVSFRDQHPEAFE